ncbi:MAG TPA: class I adenylate-forming enzyme family protein, partial [Candidatus Binatia bacterium]|nr:class I adenylate-forming enzyme family protein [Candidatus Binatia bacterium]
MNLMMLLEMAASGHPERVAVQDETNALTYAELFEAAGRAAALAKASGAAHVAMLDVTSVAMPIALFGSSWAGLPYVPLNYRLTGAELDALLERIKPAYLVTDAERAMKLGVAGITTAAREPFLAQARDGGEKAAEWSMEGDDIAVLLFTSGTTGVPKAAVLRQKHLVSYILGSVEFGGAGEDEATLVSVPPYHVAGIAAVLSSVYGGRRIVQLSSFSAEAWLELARRERVTNAFVVPTMLARIVDALEGKADAGLPHLRAVAYGGGKMPLPIIEKAMKLFPTTAFTNAYGLTETSSTIAVLGPEDHRAAAASSDSAVKRRLVSVGRPLPGVEIEIRDDEGRPVPPGTSGEVYVRGEQVSGEYLGRASNVGTDGWFPTRDGGSIDADGYLFLEGRIDDVIVRGGENLSPGEIEEVLLEHDGVADCAVVGVPDVQWGEAVAAVIVPHAGHRPSTAELCEWVKARLRSSRVPTRIELWDELPYNETG